MHPHQCPAAAEVSNIKAELLAVAFATALVGAFASPAHAAGDASPAQDPRDIPLVDTTGMHFRIRDLAGMPLAITFVASRCTEACPIANAAFAQLEARLRRDRIAARLLTITLDPEYDTPFVLAAVSRQYTTRSDTRWRFASGDVSDIRRLMRTFGVIAEKGREGKPDVHGTFVYILDRHARLAKSLLLSTALASDGEAALRDLGPRTP